MSGNSNTSLIPNVAREVCLMLLVVVFAGIPFFEAAARIPS